MSLIVKNAVGSRCSLAYCTSLWSNNNDEIHISFFKFPKDHSRFTSWVEKCETQYLPTADLDVLYKTYKLCSLPFETDMFQNVMKNRLTKTAIPTIFAKKPAKYQDNSFVGCKNFDTSNLPIEGSLMADDIFSTDDHPSCSTPVLSSSRSIIGGSVSVSTSTEICEVTTGLQTPGHLSLKTTRKETLLYCNMDAAISGGAANHGSETNEREYCGCGSLIVVVIFIFYTPYFFIFKTVLLRVVQRKLASLVTIK